MARFPLGRLARGEFPGRDTATVAARTGPTINRGKGNNNAATPWAFINAVRAKFGPLTLDLAATDANRKAPYFISERSHPDGGSLSPSCSWTNSLNSFVMPRKGGLAWLNPPFTNITPWARKCAEECQLGARILLLIPASVGANYYWDWIVPYADVYSVGRMVFDDCYDREGKLITTPFPKDLVLAHYDWSPNRCLRTGAMNTANAGSLYRWRWAA